MRFESRSARTLLSRSLLVLSIGAVLSAPLAGNPLPYDQGAIGLAQSLRELQTTISMLHVVAHPDDEDGALMTYAARGLGWRSMLFSLTRGEGGANLISSDFFDELGALRTLEHHQAARYYGSELFYSRAADYGYSKTLEEANQTWREGAPILRDLVEVIRRERPTLLFSRFRGDSRDGHGHHQMAGVLSRRAYRAAADANAFPPDSAGTFPWQIEKLYTNNLRPQWRAEDAGQATVSIPTGQFSPWLGRSFAEIARFGLGFQRSQGISGHEGEAGPRPALYRLLAAANLNDLPAAEANPGVGIDPTLVGFARRVGGLSGNELAGWQAIQADVQAAVDAFSHERLAATVPHLIRGLSRTQKLLDAQYSTPRQAADAALAQQLQQKLAQFRQALRQALGIQFKAWGTEILTDSEPNREFQHVTPGDQVNIQVRFVQRSSVPVTLRQVELRVPSTWQSEPARSVAQSAGDNEVLEWTLTTRLGQAANPTRQTWKRASIAEPFYNVTADHAQRPLPDPPAEVRLSIQLPDGRFTLTETVEVRVRHPEYGNVRYPLTVVPPVSVRFPQRHGMLSIHEDDYDVAVTVRGDRSSGGSSVVRLRLPNGWRSEPESQPFHFRKEGEEATFMFRVIPTQASLAAGQAVNLGADVHIDGQSIGEGFQVVSARDLGRLNLYREAIHTVRTVDVRLTTRPKTGYIMGSGDEVPEALRQLGVSVSLLGEEDLAQANLQDFDLIIVGVRAYAVREDVRRFNQRLLDFVKAGGTLIVQYQTPEFDRDFGPFPYVMGRNPEEVSEEDAVVTILDPNHRVFRAPNQITSSDFDDWIEQRGSKFISSWDPRYEALLECHDRGQSPQRGGMLVASHGRGVYVYCAYAWYRQLPHAVPGAYRLFANLISLRGTTQQ